MEEDGDPCPLKFMLRECYVSEEDRREMFGNRKKKKNGDGCVSGEKNRVSLSNWKPDQTVYTRRLGLDKDGINQLNYY